VVETFVRQMQTGRVMTCRAKSIIYAESFGRSPPKRDLITRYRTHDRLSVCAATVIC
jgi:hypothetical protein